MSVGQVSIRLPDIILRVLRYRADLEQRSVSNLIAVVMTDFAKNNRPTPVVAVPNKSPPISKPAPPAESPKPQTPPKPAKIRLEDIEPYRPPLVETQKLKIDRSLSEESIAFLKELEKTAYLTPEEFREFLIKQEAEEEARLLEEERRMVELTKLVTAETK